jgi:hypothetical protein
MRLVTAKSSFSRSLAHVSLSTLAACLAVSSVANAQVPAFGQYGSAYRTIAAPAIATGSFFVAADALADGRTLALSGRNIWLESAPNSGQFAVAAQLDPALVSNTDPSFVVVSPDGMLVAIGTGQLPTPLVIAPTNAILAASGQPLLPSSGTRYLNHPSIGSPFAAAWSSPTSLAVTSSGNSVRLLDLASPLPVPPSSVLISPAPGVAGLVFDQSGRLFVGDLDGMIRVFQPSQLGQTPAVSFAQGYLFADVLSASPMLFDAGGNMLVGGGDSGFLGTPPDFGYFAVIERSAVARAAAGGPAINSGLSAEVRRLTPVSTPEFYSGFLNRRTGRLYIDRTTFGGNAATTWFVTAACRADVDANAMLSVGDIFVFLTHWFSNQSEGDWDRSGTVSVEDVFAFLASWFEGCAP